MENSLNLNGMGFSVEHKRDPNDRRAYAIYLSERSRTLLTDLETLVKASERRAIGNLSDTEVKDLLRLLNKINEY